MTGREPEVAAPPRRWCIYCRRGVIEVQGRWLHVLERGPHAVKCDPLRHDSTQAEPAPEGMRGVVRRGRNVGTDV